MLTRKRRASTEKMVLTAVLTALVVVLQFISLFCRFSMFSITLVLVPIIVGAATCGILTGGWLGLVFGVAVLLTGDANAFLAINPFGTVLTVLLKGVACGFVAGLVYKLLERFNRYVAVVVAAIACPVVNTGVFLIGCLLFFYDTVTEWGAGLGFENTAAYMFLGLAGINFLIELGTNLVLSPVVVRLLNMRKGNKPTAPQKTIES